MMELSTFLQLYPDSKQHWPWVQFRFAEDFAFDRVRFQEWSNVMQQLRYKTWYDKKQLTCTIASNKHGLSHHTHRGVIVLSGLARMPENLFNSYDTP